MAGLSRTIHPASRHNFGPLATIAPDVSLRLPAAADGNGGGPEEPQALAFTDPDGETHVYLFDEAGKQRLVQTLTGGIIIPS